MLLNLLTGIGLSTATGFRVFIPLLTMNLATYFGYIQPPQNLEWITSPQALIILIIATIVEFIAYEIPWFNNIVNMLSIPFATIAGVILTASFLTDINPVQQWALAIIAGGGTALATDIFSNTAHVALTTTTAGTANPALALIETIITIIISIVVIIAITIPIALIIIPIVIKIFRSTVKKKKKVTVR
ncbi:DUF4126 domain-containing protein [Alkalicella caledoniensis]|uniref:DUF4126 domain-containing protein n=1 Tax=Alkalicella caledoniensis TaxID=2731377 RepID=A0A7G9WAV6_ALKCA|nr:DUF4126 domain-containing protein [Alkalicella caledoniensis]QNO15818.1 DUF4126 domain-containing protein [Alkalicella caledoniensis]